MKPVAKPILLPKRFESLPTAKAAPAEPNVNKAVGNLRMHLFQAFVLQAMLQL